MFKSVALRIDLLYRYARRSWGIGKILCHVLNAPYRVRFLSVSSFLFERILVVLGALRR